MDLIGKVLGNYRIDEQVGEGGMGRVYKAHHEHTHRVVAIKALRYGLGDDARVRERLIQEQQILDQVRHTNIVALHDIYFEGPQVFLVMEFVEGYALGDFIEQQGPLPIPSVMAIGQQLTSALAYAHAAGVIHRDIKPGNILVSPAGGSVARVKLLDFGIAKATDSAGLTLPGMVMGSPAYLPPERWEGEDPTPATDIYPLGLCLWGALAGRPAIASDGGFRAYYRLHTETDIPDVREARPDTPEWLALAIHKATRRDPAARYANGREMLRVFRKNTPLSSAFTLSHDPDDDAPVPSAVEITQRRGDDGTDEEQPHWSELAAGALNKPASARSARTRAFLRKAQTPYKRIAQGLTAAGGLVFLGIIGAALLIAGGLVGYALLYKPPPPVFVLELSNLKAQDVKLECTAGAGEAAKSWKEILPAGEEAAISIPTFPASCWEVNASGGKELVWTTPRWVSLLDEVEDTENQQEPVDATSTTAGRESPPKTGSTQHGGKEKPSSSAKSRKPSDEKPTADKEQAEPQVARVFLGSPKVKTTEQCGDLVALEPQAVMGELDPSTVACLEMAISEGDSLVSNSKRSRLLIGNAKGRNDQVAWERLVKRHLDEIELSDPEMCLAYALHQSNKGGVTGDFEAIKYAGIGLQSKDSLTGDLFVKRVIALHRIRSNSAVRLWQHYENTYQQDRTEKSDEAAGRLRSMAKEYAREWLDYAVAAKQPVDDAKAICRSAAGTASYCD